MAFLLQQCADFLTGLKWHSTQFDRQFKETMVEFPTLPFLQSLSLAHGLNPSPSILRSLISPLPACRLVHLDIPFPSDALGKFLDDHGNMPTLKSFVWTSLAADEGWPMQFLSDNTQLETLSLTWPPAFLMDQKLLPLLRNGFLHLLLLEIGYDESVITVPGLAFEAIASIKTLEQLHWTAGREFGTAHTWVIDHAAIRRCVKQLPNLKTLALSRDTYGEQHGLDVNNEFYYEDGWISPEPQNVVEACILDCIVFGPRDPIAAPADDPEEQSARFKCAWEMIHRRRILQLGNKYVNLRYKGGPKLEFLYFGQLPMEVTHGWYGYRARAVTERRDECYALLQRMFKRKYARFTGD